MKSINIFRSPYVMMTQVLVVVLIAVSNIYGQSETIMVNHFNKVIVSPHIQVTFVKGTEESVTIETNKISKEKINIKVQGKTLRIYLDDAKTVTKSERVLKEKWKGKHSIYQGTIVTATVTYTVLSELSLRGEETFVCKSTLEGEKFRLKIYGESQVYLNGVILEALHATMYGESYLEIKRGAIDKQKFTCYGSGKINTVNVQNISTKVTAYGEGHFILNVSENLKVTAYGEADVAYKGTPNVSKGIIIGEAKIRKI